MEFNFDILNNIFVSKPIGEGSSREVYRYTDFVVKKAKNPRGYKECSNEHFLYKNVSIKYKKHLCPILAYQEGVIVMSYAEPISLEEFNNFVLSKCSETITYLQDEYNMDDFDLKCHFNWGKINQEYVIIDYGHNYFDEELFE